jgi:hypothetical protein
MSAIRFVRAGRGHGRADVPVVDLGAGKDVWHILEAGSRGLCKSTVAIDAIEYEVDAKVIRFRNKPVCGRCRARLGPVPMPSLVRPGGLK